MSLVARGLGRGAAAVLVTAGLGLASSGATPGYRSLLAPWLGGAAQPAAVVYGYASLLGRWLGGAVQAETAVSLVPPVGGIEAPPRYRFRVAHWVRQEEEEILAVIAAWLRVH